MHNNNIIYNNIIRFDQKQIAGFRRQLAASSHYLSRVKVGANQNQNPEKLKTIIGYYLLLNNNLANCKFR